MPKGQPFTVLCQLAARLNQPRVADLHVHTTASDGEFTPSQVVLHAMREKLAAVAVTDHDTLASVVPAVEAAAGLGHAAPAVIPGVEVSAEFAGREVHLLGYFVDPLDEPLARLLAGICERRRERFRAFVAKLAANGVEFPPGLTEAEEAKAVSLGRRHVAGLLVRAGVVRGRFAAFQRFVIPLTAEVSVNHRVPAAAALRAICGAGGVASLAHPPEEIEESALAELRELGIQAVEAAYPTAGAAHTTRLRVLAATLGLAVTGGSDCHGPEPISRRIGARGVTRDELAALRQLAGRGA
jgi:predicted metal-dependent phosphoesterase TrpH